jgi:uncharacterized delta-60 repeat protein
MKQVLGGNKIEGQVVLTNTGIIVNDETVEKIAVLLQSLDSNNNPDDGIMINQDIKNRIALNGNIKDKTNAELDGTIRGFGIIPKSSSDALNHLLNYTKSIDNSVKGYVLSSFFGKFIMVDTSVSSIAIDSNGKIVAGVNFGSFSLSEGGNGGRGHFGLVRFNTDGSLDSTFGTDGKVIIEFENSTINSIAIDSNGKMVVGGYIANTLINNDFLLARYNIDGSLDTTFGSNGKVSTDFGIIDDSGSGDDRINSIVIDNNGKIVVGGYTNNGNGLTRDFALARYNINGSLDDTFGSNGKVTTFFGNNHEEANSIRIDSDGKIVAGGFAVNATHFDFALARYNTNGSLDDTFDGDGKVTTDWASQSGIHSIAIYNDDKIVVAGFVNTGPMGMYGIPLYSGSGDFLLARYNIDGSLDTTFGSNGKVTTDWGSDTISSHYDVITSIAIDSNSKIVAGGNTNFGSAIARYNMDGSLDNTFDTDGKMISTIGSNNRISSMAIDANGKIVVAGVETYNLNHTNFLLARYKYDGSLDK